MQPIELKAEQFSNYPPEARKLAEHYTATLAQLPPSFVPSLLREVIEYDYKFPVERKAVEKELETITTLSPADRTEWLLGAQTGVDVGHEAVEVQAVSAKAVEMAVETAVAIFLAGDIRFLLQTVART